MKSFPKINIFLKVCGKNSDGYHLIASRFLLIQNIFDEIVFEKKIYPSKEFELVGNFGCETKKNTIYKSYIALLEETKNSNLEKFFFEHKVEVTKNIPEGSGLGGGSSNAALFLNMCNEELKLGISKEHLATIGKKVGADVPFFVYGYRSANVSGIGEIVEEYTENSLEFELIFPNIHCDTKTVYGEFSKNFYKEIENRKKDELFSLDSKDILEKYEATFLNDLYLPALALYPGLQDYSKDSFFSGSGSTFFRLSK